MDALHAMQTAAALFAIAALGGLTMAVIRLRGADRPPSSFAMLHGLLAGAGLTLLVYAWWTVGLPPFAQYSVIVLALAAAGGAFMNLRFHSQMLPLPIPLMIGHALLAVTGFALLLIALMKPAAGGP
jgi:hypothetical protein